MVETGEDDRLFAEALHFVLIYKVKNCCMGDVKRYFIACDCKCVLRHTRPSEGARHRQNCAFGRVSWTHDSRVDVCSMSFLGAKKVTELRPI